MERLRVTYRCSNCGAPTIFDKAEEGRKESQRCKECFEVLKRKEDPKRGRLLECMTCDDRAVYGRTHMDCKVCREKDWRRNRSSGRQSPHGPDSFDGGPSFENAVRTMEDGR